MKHVFLIVLSIVLLATSAPAPASDAHAGRLGRSERQVLDAERRRIAAMVQGDTDTLNAVLANELTYTHTTGRTDTKSDFITALTEGRLKYESLDTEELRVRVYGQTGVLTGRAKVRVGSRGPAVSFRMKYTGVYVRRDGRWQLAAYQATRLPEGP